VDEASVLTDESLRDRPSQWREAEIQILAQSGARIWSLI
jgi:hypothetical protein